MSKWEWKEFEDCIEHVKYTTKIPSKDYLQEGEFPIVSQEDCLISGYWNDKNDLFKVTKPIVIFGDHTKVLKYIDFDFVLGADGVKILCPRDFLDAHFFFYFLKSVNFDNLGYARHYRLLKELSVPIPSLSEQNRIVKFLDEELSKIDTLKTNAETNLKNAKELFQKTIANEFAFNTEKIKQGWMETTVGDIADIKGGKRIPKGEKLLTEKTKHPYIRVTDFNDNGSVDLDDIHYISDEIYEGIKRYIITTDDAYVSIAGTIGKCGIVPPELNNANLTENACRLIFNTNVYNRFFVYFSLSDEFKALTQKEARANAMPKLSILRLSQIKIPLPPLPVQKEIVARLDKLSENVKRLEANYKQIIANCDELKKSILKKTFEGDSRSSRE